VGAFSSLEQNRHIRNIFIDEEHITSMAIGFIILLGILAITLIYLHQFQRWHGPMVNFSLYSVILIFLSTAIYVYIQNPVNFDSLEGIFQYFQTYLSWWSSTVRKGGNLIGYVVHQDWGVNSTIGS
jgi:hypothetical protein